MYLFKSLYQLSYSRALFETGITFLNSLLNYNLVNNLYIIQNNKLLKDNGTNNSTSKYIKKIRLNKEIRINLNNDSLYQKEF